MHLSLMQNISFSNGPAYMCGRKKCFPSLSHLVKIEFCYTCSEPLLSCVGYCFHHCANLVSKWNPTVRFYHFRLDSVEEARKLKKKLNLKCKKQYNEMNL